MNSKDEASIITGIFCIVIIALLVLVIRSIDNAKWNNGVCSCGGHYIYEQSVGHRYTSTHIYKCDKCGKIIELDSIKNQEVEDSEHK